MDANNTIYENFSKVILGLVNIRNQIKDEIILYFIFPYTAHGDSFNAPDCLFFLSQNYYTYFIKCKIESVFVRQK